MIATPAFGRSLRRPSAAARGAGRLVRGHPLRVAKLRSPDGPRKIRSPAGTAIPSLWPTPQSWRCHTTGGQDTTARDNRAAGLMSLTTTCRASQDEATVDTRANGSSQQACADAIARLTVMKQIQPISWFITAVGAVILVYTALQKTEVSREKMLAPEANEDGTSNLRNEGQLARMKHVKQVKQVEMATCGNCNASVRGDALRCPSCGAQFA